MDNRTSAVKPFCRDCGRRIESLQYQVGMDFYCASCYLARFGGVQSPVPVISTVIPEQDSKDRQMVVSVREMEEMAAKTKHLEALVKKRESDLAELLDYVKAGQYSSGEDMNIHTQAGLELFNAVRGLMADAIAGDFLADEVKRLDEREKRFIKHCDALNKLVRLMVRVYPGHLLLEQIEEAAGVLELSAILNPGTDWYHYTEAQVLDMLSKADITEGGAAYLLDTDIIHVRVLMEAKFGAYWRDMADKEGEA